MATNKAWFSSQGPISLKLCRPWSEIRKTLTHKLLLGVWKKNRYEPNRFVIKLNRFSTKLVWRKKNWIIVRIVSVRIEFSKRKRFNSLTTNYFFYKKKLIISTYHLLWTRSESIQFLNHQFETNSKLIRLRTDSLKTFWFQTDLTNIVCQFWFKKQTY